MPDSIDIIKTMVPDSVLLEGKVVYVDFWASWCVPCRQSFPWMREMYNRYHRDGFEIVAVNVDKEHSAALKFLKENQTTFPIVFDSTGELAKKYGLDAMPTSFLYNRDGKLVSQNRGFQKDEAAEMQERIQELLIKGGSE
ncbi:MAG: TlpA disulfide reductase family protein [Candidatus Zixiibacteriota bacterium]